MDTVPNLKAKIAAFLQRQASDLIVNGVDLGLDAINRAHQWALMKRDFELAKVPVLYNLNLASGGALSPATLLDGSSLVTVKKVVNVFTTDGNGNRVRPIHFISQKTHIRELAQDWANRPWEFRFTDPPLAVSNTAILPAVYQVGQTLVLYPADNSTWGNGTTSVQIAADVVRWFPDYQGQNSDNDFMLQFGDDFLFWYAVHRLNKLFKEFVPQEQGNLDDKYIQQMRDEAWMDLCQFDGYEVMDELTLD